MKRLVLDTNVLVSGMINPFGPPGRIIDLVREGEVTLAVDDRILSEYTEVLQRRKFRTYFSNEEVRDIAQFLAHHAYYTVPTISITDLPDPDDVPFLEVALAAAVPLVTGNVDDFPEDRRRSVEVLTPAEYLEHFSA